MKIFNKIFLGFFLFAMLGGISNLVSSYSTYGAPAEFGNINDTTCYVGGDDGIIDCIGTVSGTIAWVNLSSYPAGCPAGSAITNLTDSTICTAFPDSDSNLTEADVDNYVANNGYLVNGSNANINYLNASNITSVYFYGNGSGLTGVAGEGAISEVVETGSTPLTFTGCDEGSCAIGLSTDLVSHDTSPQLGGYLDTAGQNIGSTSDEIEHVYVTTNYKIYLGTGQEGEVYYDGSKLVIKVN